MFRTFKNFLKNRITIFQYLPGSFNFFFLYEENKYFQEFKKRCHVINWEPQLNSYQ